MSISSITRSDTDSLIDCQGAVSVPVASQFRDAFWGDSGVELLCQNAKHANNSSKELEGFLRDRAKSEDGHAKELHKIAKHNAHVGTHVGSFAPAWMELVHNTSEKLAATHVQLATSLMELAKEVGAYHAQQKETYRQTKDQVIVPCQEALAALDQANNVAVKCKQAFHNGHHQACELAEQLAKTRDSLKQKDLEKLESRMKKAESQCQQSDTEYKAALQKQEAAVQDFKSKMVVMADRLQKNEMEHLTVMKGFVVKIFELERKTESLMTFLKKNQDKEVTLSAELMVQQFVAVRGSGSSIPTVMTYESPGEMPVIPEKSPLPQSQSQSNVSADSASITDPKETKAAAAAAANKKQWGLRKKKDKKNKPDKRKGESTGASSAAAEKDSNVDEEGYSIRPDNAARIGIKEDKESDFSYSSGSDDDTKETESKIRSISIKPIDASRDRATSTNDLTVAVQSLSILKPPGSTSKSAEHSSRSSPARNILDDDIAMPSQPQPRATGGVLEPLGAPPRGGAVAPVSSAGSATPPASTRDPSMIKLAHPTAGSSVNSASESPRSESPVMISRRSSAAAGNRSTTSPVQSSSPLNLPAALTPSVSSSPPVTVAVYALFSETVNALFKATDPNSALVKVTGELQLSFPASSINQITPNSTPLVLRLHPASCVEQCHSNTHLLDTEATATAADDMHYRFKMTALQAFLKAQREQNPTAAFYKVDIFKYQAKSMSGTSLPVHITNEWQVDESICQLKGTFVYNTKCRINPAPLKFVSLLTPTEGASNVQSSPQAQWANDRLVWKVPEISPSSGMGNFRAKMELKSGPGQPSPVAVQFNLEGHSLTGFGMELKSPTYNLALLKHRLVTGKYMAEPVTQEDCSQL